MAKAYVVKAGGFVICRTSFEVMSLIVEKSPGWWYLYWWFEKTRTSSRRPHRENREIISLASIYCNQGYTKLASVVLNLSLLITHHLHRTNLSCHPEKPPCWLGSSRLISMTSILQPANEKLLPQDRLSARENTAPYVFQNPHNMSRAKKENRLLNGGAEGKR